MTSPEGPARQEGLPFLFSDIAATLYTEEQQFVTAAESFDHATARELSESIDRSLGDTSLGTCLQREVRDRFTFFALNVIGSPKPLSYALDMLYVANQSGTKERSAAEKLLGHIDKTACGAINYAAQEVDGVRAGHEDVRMAAHWRESGLAVIAPRYSTTSNAMYDDIDMRSLFEAAKRGTLGSVIPSHSLQNSLAFLQEYARVRGISSPMDLNPLPMAPQGLGQFRCLAENTPAGTPYARFFAAARTEVANKMVALNRTYSGPLAELATTCYKGARRHARTNEQLRPLAKATQYHDSAVVAEQGIFDTAPYIRQENTRGRSNAAYRMAFAGVTGSLLTQSELCGHSRTNHPVFDQDEMLKVFATTAYQQEYSDYPVVPMRFQAMTLNKIVEINQNVKEKNPGCAVYVICNIGSIANKRILDGIWHGVVLQGINSDTVICHNPSYNEEGTGRQQAIPKPDFAKRWARAYNSGYLLIGGAGPQELRQVATD